MSTGTKIGRILAIVVIAISVLGIVVTAFGIVAVWRTNGPLTNTLVELASLAQAGLEAASEALVAVDPVLSDLQASMRQVQTNTEELKAGIQESEPIVEILSALFGQDVTPKLEEAADSFGATHQAARDLNAAALAINNVPFLDMPGIVQATGEFLDLFDTIEEKIYELDANVQALKGDVVESAVQPVQDLALEVETDLAEVQGETRDLKRQVEDAHETTTKVKSRLPLIIDLLYLVPTLVLLWGVLAQVALIYLAWLYRRFNRLDLHHALEA